MSNPGELQTERFGAWRYKELTAAIHSAGQAVLLQFKGKQDVRLNGIISRVSSRHYDLQDCCTALRSETADTHLSDSAMSYIQAAAGP